MWRRTQGHHVVALIAEVREHRAASAAPTTVWAVEAHGLTVAIAADQATADAIAARRGGTVEEWRVTTAEDYRPMLIDDVKEKVA